MSELDFMRKLEIFKFGSGEVHNLKFMSQTVNEWAAKNCATLISVSVSTDSAGYLFVAVIYEDASCEDASCEDASCEDASCEN